MTSISIDAQALLPPQTEVQSEPTHTRRGALGILGAFALSALMPACTDGAYIHDGRYQPLRAILEGLRQMERVGQLDENMQIVFDNSIANLRKSENSNAWGKVQDPELTRQVNGLLTGLSELDESDSEAVSGLVEKTEQALRLLLLDEKCLEMRNMK